MQTERVTFLTTPDHKAALDAFAANSGMSVGHVVREATSRYLAQPAAARDEEEEALALLVPEVEAAVADIKARISAMRADIVRTCATVDAVLAGERR
ncbi:hypothetical protein ASG11_14930 [Sphingomonas sp. Leaf357]|uniref:hypothetical protein n=1 Tax=Sphingomonas sp. Leaf357 TaxID=1736350 RepID=UPI0006FFE6B1|nr:hypothetical protein [Sphingomonas sp. Leaf357]KQS02084.1 hypothetical protein ASG11_14930 [Sphingomonas sp. Leaf357]